MNINLMNPLNKILNFFSKINFVCGVQFRSKILIIFLFLFILSFLELAGLGLFVAFVLSIFGKQEFIMNSIPYFQYINLNYLMILLLALYTLKLILSIYFNNKIYSYLFQIHFKLSQFLVSSYIKKPYSYFTKVNSSIIVRNVYSEVGIFTHQIILAISYIITDLILIFGLFILLAKNDFFSTIVVSLILISFFLIFSFISKPFLKKWGEILVKQKFYIHNSLKETFSSIKEIKIFNIENFFINRYSISLSEYSKAQKKQISHSQMPKFFFEYIVVIIFLLIINLFKLRGLSDDQIFSNLALFAAASLRLMPCFSRIANQFQSIIFYKPSVDILYEEFKIISKDNEKKTIIENEIKTIKTNRIVFKKTINLIDVSMSYSGRNILNNINLILKKNNILGIFGQSGEGKTTLIDMICGIIKPTGGKILIDNKYDISNLPYKKEWLNKIGYVTQDIYLLNDTIKSNILYGDEKFDNNKLQKVLKMSQLNNFIDNLKFKENTLVGENGINFSGGQKKRLAIARALYREPELIIFDETTSSLDLQNEKKIFQMLTELKNERCVIIVSHSKKTLEYCDKVFEVKNFKVQEIFN